MARKARFHIQRSLGDRSPVKIKVYPAANCPGCGRLGSVLYARMEDRLFGAPGVWSVLACQRCDILWVDPCPEPTAPGLYDSYFTHNPPRPAWSGRGRRSRILNLWPPWRQTIRFARLCADELPGTCVLDVGCGNGRFLSAMVERGWTGVGIEPDARAAATARAQSRCPVHESPLPDARLASQSFDVVVLDHVIEHLHNPIDTLRECKRVLRPDGAIIITTPNAHSLAHRLFRRYWRGLEVPRHIHIFSARSLVTAVHSAGFERPHIQTLSRSAAWMWTTSIRSALRLGNSASPAAAAILLVPSLLFHTLEYYLPESWYLGEELYLRAFAN